MQLPKPPQKRDRKKEKRKPRYKGISRSADRVQNLKALMDHFGIDHGDHKKWYLLALGLANAHVRDFKPELKRGRKKCEVSDEFDRHLFYVLSNALREGLSVSEAIRRVMKDPYFEGMKFGALRRRYYLLKPYWDRLREEQELEWEEQSKY
jgi:hypothetical protein